MALNPNVRFLSYVVGIFSCYLYFGILQETITRGKYVVIETTSDGQKETVTERFTYMLALCSVQCVLNFLFAKAMLYFWPQGEDKTRTSYYACTALTYLLAMICSNMALQWVPYPTQVIGKSAKPIPVMLLGVLVGHKSYPLKKYVFVFLIVAGIIMFMYKEKVGPTVADGNADIGHLLVFMSLTMDGLTGAVQERMRAEAAPSAQQMMVNMNYWSCIFLGVGLITTGEGFGFMSFLSRHPFVAYDMMLLGITGALGQLFIFLMVSEHGPLPCSIVTTTRKFFTILGSVFFFGNTLIFRQWIGAVVVFCGLFLDAYFGKSPPKKK